MPEIKVDAVVNLAGTGKPNFPVSPTHSGGSALSTLNTHSYTSSGTEPSSPKNGAIWWDSSNNKVMVYINNEFKEISLNSAYPASYTLPTATVLHLENPATNYSSGTWTATVGANVSFTGTFSTGTDSNSNSYLSFGSSSYGSISSIALPSNLCIMSVVEESSSAFLVEHSVNANQNDGMYHYSDLTHVYGVKRGSATRTGYNPKNAAGDGNEDPVDNATKTLFGSNLKSDNSVTGMFYSSKFDGKRDGTINAGSAQSHSSATTALYIGSRAGTGVYFTGKLYELYITAALTDENFDAAIGYFKNKFSL